MSDRRSTEAEQFRTGLLKTVPVVIGVIPFGLAYGVLAVQAGLSIGETLLMSLVVFAGASQFMAAGMFQAGAGGPMIVFSTLLMNLRHLVMGLSLSPYFAHTTPRWRRMLAFGMVDESYLVSVTHFRERGQTHGSRHFMLASASLMYVVWAVSSLAGAVAGHSIADPLKWGLDFAMPATFLTLLLPQVVSARLAAVVAVAATAATTAYVLIPGTWYILIAMAAGTGAGLLLDRRTEDESGHGAESRAPQDRALRDRALQDRGPRDSEAGA
jgi:4-azaleucine resistance transporter AzlC